MTRSRRFFLPHGRVLVYLSCEKSLPPQALRGWGNRLAQTRKLPPVVVSPVFVNGTAVLRAFRRRGAHCVAVSSRREVSGFSTRAACEKIYLPEMERSPGVFTRWLLSRRDLEGALVVPTGDEIVAELDANRETLAQRFHLCIPSAEICRIALDKLALARTARAACVPGPQTFEVAPDTDAQADPGIDFPLLVKPRSCIDFSRAFGKKVAVAADAAALEGILSKCRDLGIRTVLQELLPPEGPVVAYNGYVRRSGEVAGDFTTLRRAMFPPQHGTGFFEVAEPIEEVLEYSRALLSALDYRGALVNMDFKFDPRERLWKLLDLNARSWRQVSLAAIVGVDVFEHMLRDYTGAEPLSNGPVRYGAAWFYIKDALLMLRAYPGDSPRIKDYLDLLCNKHSLGLFDKSDMRPFLADLKPLLLRRLGKLAPRHIDQ